MQQVYGRFCEEKGGNEEKSGHRCRYSGTFHRRRRSSRSGHAKIKLSKLGTTHGVDLTANADMVPASSISVGTKKVANKASKAYQEGPRIVAISADDTGRSLKDTERAKG